MSNSQLTPTWVTAGLAASSDAPTWLRELQQRHGQAFVARGMPSRREEQWKYTDVTFLNDKVLTTATVTSALVQPLLPLQNQDSIVVVLINGCYTENLSDLRLLPKGVVLCSLKQAMQTHAEQVQRYLTQERNSQHYPFANLNMALLSDGIFLFVPKNVVVPVPIHIHVINAEADAIVTNPRYLLIADDNSQVTVLEEHSAQQADHYFTNSVTEIHVGINAQLQYHKIQNEAAQATHIAQTFVSQQRDSQVKLLHLTLGARLAREDIVVNLNETGAECSVRGLYALQHDGQHADHHVLINHLVPHGTSHMVYKGILDNKSHAVFNGKVFVQAAAQKTQSYQMNQNLLLSARAGVDTKPEFEIYADDVKCAHGATIGQLDTEALFYLRSRGIDKATSLKLLTQAFAAEVFDHMTQPAIKHRMQTLLSERLTYEN